MEKINLKFKLPVMCLFVACLIILSLSLFALKKQREEEIIYQKLQQEQLALKEKERIAKERDYLMGKFDQSQRDDFIFIPKEYTVNTNEMYLRKETFSAFLKMQNSAKQDGVNLKIASATRNFEYQKNLWNNKWNGYTSVNGKNLLKSIPNSLKRFEKILEFSAAPGTSRHHFGTDIDINNANPEYFENKEGKKVYEWLTTNALLFGFCQPYNLKGTTRPTGYNEEKWHWSYLPLAKTFTQEYKSLIKEEDIKGFLGDENVEGQDLINDYVLGINPECL